MKRFNFVFADGVIYIKVAIAGEGAMRDYRFLLDTGASASVISQKSTEALGFDVNSLPLQLSQPVATASGIIFPKYVILKTFEAFGRTLSDFSISVIDFPDDIDGVIGNDFLSLFERVKIFYPTATQEACIEVG